MRILVTGANGYLGAGIVEAIINSGNEVIAADIKVDHVDDRILYADGFKQDHTFFWKKLDISIIISDK